MFNILSQNKSGKFFICCVATQTSLMILFKLSETNNYRLIGKKKPNVISSFRYL